MNKFLKRITAVLLLAMMLPPVASAQDDQMTQPLPIDPAVRIGKLPNGLTYYIRHNEYPKGQADFYLAQNVGSAQWLKFFIAISPFFLLFCGSKVL